MYSRPFKWWVQSVMPLVFDDSLSYYEVLAKLTKYIEGLTGDVDQIEKILATIEGIEDVTQFAEMLESIKNEIGDLSNLSTQSKTNLVSAINEIALKADIAYYKPPTGIPESDLSQGVQDKLNKTGEATKYIINNKELKAAPSNNSPADLGLGTYSVPAGGIPWDTLSQDVQDRINAGGGGEGGTKDYTELINKPQINGHTLNAGNNTAESLGIGTYSKPALGIPESDLSAQVQEKLNTSGGIADSENSFVATRDYEAGELIYINGVLYKTKYKILSGTNLIPGNNIEETDISNEIEKINSDIEALQSGSGPDSWTLATNIEHPAVGSTTRFFEYFNCIGTESYLFIVTPVRPAIGGAYYIYVRKKDGTQAHRVQYDASSNETQHRFTFVPTDTGEYYCEFENLTGYTSNLNYRIEIEYTESQGISELWSQVNKANQLEPRVSAVETLVGEQQEQLEELNNIPERIETLESDVNELKDVVTISANLFDKTSPSILPLFINPSRNNFSSSDDNRLVVVEVEKQTDYIVRCGGISTKRIGLSANLPAVSGSVNVQYSGISDYVNVVVNSGNYNYLSIQLYVDADTDKDATHYYDSILIVPSTAVNCINQELLKIQSDYTQTQNLLSGQWLGGLISRTDGSDIAGNGKRTNSYFDADETKKYYFACKGGTCVAYFYDENKGYLECTTGNRNFYSFSLPTGTKYIRMSASASAYDIILSEFTGANVGAYIPPTTMRDSTARSDIDLLYKNASPNSIKVCTFNVGKWYNGSTRVPTELLAERKAAWLRFLGKENIDLIGAQEVYQYFDIDQNLEAFDFVLNNNFLAEYAPVWGSTDDHGNAIITKRPMIYRGYYSYGLNTGALTGIVFCGGKAIPFIDVHMAINNDRRASDMMKLVEWLSGVEYGIIFGDFNIVDVAEYDVFAGYNMANCGVFGEIVTYPESEDASHGCIDNIITTTNITIEYAYTVDSSPTINDHKPLIARLLVH